MAKGAGAGGAAAGAARLTTGDPLPPGGDRPGGELHRGCAPARPHSITSPCLSPWRWMRTPLTKVPLRLPVSTTNQPSSTSTISQWRPGGVEVDVGVEHQITVRARGRRNGVDLVEGELPPGVGPELPATSRITPAPFTARATAPGTGVPARRASARARPRRPARRRRLWPAGAAARGRRAVGREREHGDGERDHQHQARLCCAIDAELAAHRGVEHEGRVGWRVGPHRAHRGGISGGIESECFTSEPGGGSRGA